MNESNSVPDNPTPVHCPRCDRAIPADAPGGVCPACLMALNLAAQTELTAQSGDDSPPSLPPVPSLDAIAAAFPQFEIEGMIGRGGMGAVFKARQPRLNRFVALKILPESLASQPAFAERFAREGQLLARLAHPNIVAVHDFGQANGYFYLIMEYVDGVNLRQALRAGRFSPSQALAIVPKICDALQYAHEEGVFHRDIKPENILLDQKGRVKLADFGIAKLADASDACAPEAAGGAAGDLPPSGTALTRAAERLGTPQYMAPEQAEQSATVDHRADIYSLGVVFYELLTGELPSSTLVPPSQRSSVDPRVDDVVRRALAKEKSERYQTADEFKTGLTAITGTAPPEPPLLRSPAPVRRTGLKIALISAAVLLVLAVLVATPIVFYFLRSAQQRDAVRAARWAEEQAKIAAQKQLEAYAQADARNAPQSRPALRLAETRTRPSTESSVAPKPLGFIRLIAGGPHKNIAIARSESVIGHPLHRVVVHFAGPPIPEDRWVEARMAVWGPMLYPSAQENPNDDWHPEPIDSESIRALDTTLKPSSAWFAAPSECQLEFAMADTADATEASRQMNLALTDPVALEPGRRLELFRVREWSAWLEAQPHPVDHGFSVRRTRSRSPAFATISNLNESALITVPAGYDLGVRTRISSSRPQPVSSRMVTNEFEATLSSPPGRSGVYWLVWHTLPVAGPIEMEPKPEWILQLHDAATATQLHVARSRDSELIRRTAPPTLGWRRSSAVEITNAPPSQAYESVLFSGTADQKEGWWVTLHLEPQRRP